MGVFISGSVVCGFPSPGEENREDQLDFNSYLVRHACSTFCLRAYGSSMAPFICENDILVVDRSLSARSGDVVVAQCNGDFTVKYLRKTESGFLLVPENPSFDPIPVEASTRLFGVVTSVVRKLRS